MSEVETGIVGAVPFALATLVGGLNGGHAQATALNQSRVLRRSIAVLNSLNHRKQAAGQHQKDDDDGHGESLSLFDLLGVLF